MTSRRLRHFCYGAVLIYMAVSFLIFLLQVLPLDLLGQHTTISIGTRNSLSIFTGRAVLASLRHDNEANTHQ